MEESKYNKYKDSILKYQKNRYHNDEEYRNERKKISSENYKKKYSTDPKYKEEKKAKNNEYQRKLREAKAKLIELGISV